MKDLAGTVRVMLEREKDLEGEGKTLTDIGEGQASRENRCEMRYLCPLPRANRFWNKDSLKEIL